jgi:Tfp pilus assembly protein PilF
MKTPGSASRSRPAKTDAAGAQTWSKERLWSCLILGCILLYTGILFSSSLNNSFLDWDDNSYVRDNVDIRGLGLSNLKAMFTHFYVGNWQPLTILTYALEYSFVEAGSPFLYRLDNLILHLLNTILVFYLCMVLARKKWVAALTALFFSIHPMRVESVAWVAERKDVLYSFFFLLALIAYHYYLTSSSGMGSPAEPRGCRPDRADAKGATRCYLLVLACFVLSGLSKSAAVVLPVVLLLFDFFYRRTFTPRRFLEKIPFFLAAGFFGIMALKSQDASIGEWPRLALVERVLIVNHSFLRYFFMTVIPVHLSALHPYPDFDSGHLPRIYYAAAPLTLLLAGIAAFSLRFTRVIAFGLLFFLTTIALVLQITPVGRAVVAERYTYLPHVGFFFVISYYLMKLWDRQWRLRTPARILLGLGVGVWIALFSATTIGRNGVWENGLTLWTDVIEKYPNSAYSGYYNRGKVKQDMKDLDGALLDYDAAVRLNPGNYRAMVNRGIIKQERGLLDEALVDFDSAIGINPAYYVAYIDRGVIRKRKEEFEGAGADFSRAIELNPNQVESWYNRGTVRFALEDYEGALVDFDNAMRLQDNYRMIYNYRASCKLYTGDKEGACRDWRRGADLGDEACRVNLEKTCQ